MTLVAGKYLVREFVDGDRAQVVRLLEDLQRYLVEGDPQGRSRCGDGFGEHALGELKPVVDTQQGKIFVVVGPVGLVGFAAGFVCRPQSAADLLDVVANRQGFLAKLYLDPEVRGEGLARSLVSLLEAHLLACGCDNMWVDVNTFNPAVSYYEHSGYVPRELGMLKALTSAEDDT